MKELEENIISIMKSKFGGPIDLNKTSYSTNEKIVT